MSSTPLITVRDGLAELITRLRATADANSYYYRKAHAIAVLYDIAAGAAPPEGFEPPREAARSIIGEYLHYATRALDIANYAGALDVLVRAQRIATVLADSALLQFVNNLIKQCNEKIVEQRSVRNGYTAHYAADPSRTEGESTPGSDVSREL
jgi:hypothetical protein